MIERYLVDVLGVPWHLADEEVRKMEPGVSDVVFERMRAALRRRCRPVSARQPDPGHGCRGDARSTTSSRSTDATSAARVASTASSRTSSSTSRCCKYLEEHELLPGAELEVSERDPRAA